MGKTCSSVYCCKALFISICALVLVTFIIVAWFNVISAGFWSLTGYTKGRNKNHKVINKYSNVTGDRWIVVTTLSYSTQDIQLLAKIPGWKVLVVGDSKVPSNWSLPNCTFLNIYEQYEFGFETVEHLPEQSYARKTVGYLFAIAHGAKVVYESDGKRPIDQLKSFVMENTMLGLLYNGKGVFNPYTHFGQQRLWPCSYQPSVVGGNVNANFLLNNYSTTSIQHGVVDGELDVDAVLRLTWKQTRSIMNETFERKAPPIIIPSGAFSSFNFQNTLVMYDALWALLIPTTTTFRISDIWRGYWAQRLLWETRGNIGFIPFGHFCGRNCDMCDLTNDNDQNIETQTLITFLTQWRCKPEKAFFDCMVQLSTDMVYNQFWKERDELLTKSWVRDLINIGYNEPFRKPFDLFSQDVLVSKEILFSIEKTLPSQLTNSTLRPRQQTPTLRDLKNDSDSGVAYLIQLTPLCKNTSISILRLSARNSITSFPNILLIIVFNFPYYSNIPILESMYRMHFPHILYCGANKTEFDYQTQHMKHVAFIEVYLDHGVLAQNCLTMAMKVNYTMDGYLYIGDDTLLNVWNLHKLPWDQLWLIRETVLRQSEKVEWPWFSEPNVGLKSYQAALNASKSLDKKRFDKFFTILAKNTGYKDGLFKAPSDIAYVPKGYREDAIYFLEHFSKFHLFLEIAVPTVFYGIEMMEKVYNLPGTYLWYDGKRDHIEKYFKSSDIFLHPVKILKEFKTKKGITFFCETFLPLTLEDGFPEFPAGNSGKEYLSKPFQSWNGFLLLLCIWVMFYKQSLCHDIVIDICN